jgi:hypothetical protein
MDTRLPHKLLRHRYFTYYKLWQRGVLGGLYTQRGQGSQRRFDYPVKPLAIFLHICIMLPLFIGSVMDAATAVFCG